ncbi:MAG: glycosyltransferase [Xenococcaceae cyanobacterium MO_188.B32]|nr:glycosyltransferase [Xenococcaceae cyanobacterium MO_188.B32]
MKILQVHNQYRHRSGEEVVVEAEQKMLTNYGHQVEQWIVKSSDIENARGLAKAGIALQSIWSSKTYGMVKKQIKNFEPDIVHVHNTVPLISPSVYSACRDANVPVVKTLHSYKLICPGAYLYRDGKICEDCISKPVKYPSVIHGCYRHNRFHSAITTTGLAVNRFQGTYQKDVDIFIALTRFARQKFIEGGFPAEKIAVKPNFIASNIQPGEHQGKYALFVGKLVKYKGIETFLKAWDLLEEPIPLKVVGKGPLDILLKGSIPSGIEYLGALPREKVLELMQNASFLIFPSEWYEPFGMVVIEAFATGLPVIGSYRASSREIIKDGYSGWHFKPENAEDLARVVKETWSNPDELKRRGNLARKQYEQCYSAEVNYQMLLNIYQTAIERTQNQDFSTVF